MSTTPAARGDVDLAGALDGLASGLASRIAVAVVDTHRAPETRFAFVNADAQRRFEIGSITKGLTGMILADAISRGEISLGTTVGEVFPLMGGDVGSIAVQELCTHTSGLPRAPRRPYASLRRLRYGVFQLNPYHGITTSEMLKLTAQQQLSNRGQRRYSNLGAAILGQLLVVRSGAEFPQLLKDRILHPMGLRSTEVTKQGDTAPWGRSPAGLPRQPWVMGCYAPAGGVYSTLEDMAQLARKLLSGSAPGLHSLEPFDGVPTDRANRNSGMFWSIDSDPGTGRRLVWHSGGTGGYSSLLGILPHLQRAVVVLANVGNNTVQIEHVARGLMRSLDDST